MTPPNRIYSRTLTIPSSVIDENGHVNNVAYVQWMQDIAVEHYASIGGVEVQGAEATWFVREHKIEYFLPAFAGEEVEIRTWVENVRRVRSLRKYEFIRKSDGQLLVRGETDWVFVQAASGRPLPIPEEVSRLFQLPADDTDGHVSVPQNHEQANSSSNPNLSV